MADNRPRLLDVLVATYDNVREAEADLKAVRELYTTLGTSYNFDAAVVSKDQKGKVRIDKTYEAGRRHDALKGIGVGLAAGIVAAAFPPVGIALALGAGGVAGAAIGAIVGHVHSGIPRVDLGKIAEQLDASEAALIVVYETSVANRITESITAIHRTMTKIADLKAAQVADEIRRALDVHEPVTR